MPNAPLHHCPLCGSDKRPSYVRCGAWLNKHCPQANGPVDADDYPAGLELDFLARRRWARLEIKRPGENVPVGQATHLRALHGMASNGWDVLLLLVWDEGQSEDGEQVRFSWCWSRREWEAPQAWREHRTTLEALGMSIASWVWCGADRPGFMLPPPPACAVCGDGLPRRPEQTIPRASGGGPNVYVCVSCFHDHMQRAAASRLAEAQAAEDAALGIGETRMERLV